MTIITRKRVDRYAIVPNAVADDDRLTFEERGVLVYLLAKPHDWNVSVKNLQNQGNIGRDKVYRILRNLEIAGYLSREQTTDERGRFGSYNYTIHDDAVPECLPLPLPENQEAESPLPENPVTGNPVNGKTDTYKEPISQITPQAPLEGGSEDSFERLVSMWPMDKIGKREAAEDAFLGLDPEKRRRAIDCAKTYLLHATRRKERLCRLSVYLTSNLFDIVYGAPEVDIDGYYRIHPERAEWKPWLERVKDKYGDTAVAGCVERGWLKAKTRWPEENRISA